MQEGELEGQGKRQAGIGAKHQDRDVQTGRHEPRVMPVSRIEQKRHEQHQLGLRSH